MAKSLLQRKLEFIEKSKKKFGDKFNYDKVDYKDATTPVILICKIHGEFEMTPKAHLVSTTGCKECSKHVIRKQKTLIDGQDRKLMKEYRIWKAIKTRTLNKNTDSADRYILRGITMCDSWRDSFEEFYNDMGKCPDGCSIDRIDPNGNYEPTNCRWANDFTQSQNRGEFNKTFTHNNETHVLKEWARILNINYGTLYARIYRSNLSFEQAIQEDPFSRLIELDGEKHTLKEWSKIYNIKYSTVINRVDKHHWSYNDALKTPLGERRNKCKI